MDWATSACTMLAPGASAGVTFACAVLVVLLVVAVLLGFGPLRARLDGRSTHPASRVDLDSDADLSTIWRLYRGLHGAERRQTVSRHAMSTTNDRTPANRTEAQTR